MKVNKLCGVCHDMCRKSTFLRLHRVSQRLEQSQQALDNELREEARLLTIFYSFDDDTDTEHFIHHKSKRDLMFSAALGCHLCSLAGNTSWNPYLELGRFSINGGRVYNTGRH